MTTKKDIIRKANVNVVYKKGDRLIVHVSKKLPLSNLKEKDIVPRFVEGLRTNVIEKGEINYYNSNKYRPIIGGISCINSQQGFATLGVIVLDSTTGKLAGLTCNHCVGTLFDINYDWPTYGNTALSHILMLQPSPGDGGTVADSLGAPYRAIATQFGEGGSNIVDAAIIRIPWNMAKTDIQNIDQGPFKFIDSKLDYGVGTSVWKNGRTTDLTQGTIVSTSVDVYLTLPGEPIGAHYSDQIMIEGDSISGDSGSVVVTKTSGGWKILGLLFGGGGGYFYANHIIDVANLLQIEAWDGSIVVDAAEDYILVNGRCYQYKGYSLKPESHNDQKGYDNCASCKVDAYPNAKIQVIN